VCHVLDTFTKEITAQYLRGLALVSFCLVVSVLLSFDVLHQCSIEYKVWTESGWAGHCQQLWQVSVDGILGIMGH
jgi:hypothetical protein